MNTKERKTEDVNTEICTSVSSTDNGTIVHSPSFYSTTKIDGYNALFNFIIGAKSIGKSFALKEKVVQRFLKNNETFIYMRRYKKEVDRRKMQKFFSDVATKHNWNITYNGSFCIDGKPFGIPMSLSTASTHASEVFKTNNSFVGTIIFDEVISRGGTHPYLKNEVQLFLETYATISRGAKTKVYFLGNEVNSSLISQSSNPYFDMWGIKKIHGIQRVNKQLCVEYCDMTSSNLFDESFMELVHGTDFERSLINNEIITDLSDIRSVDGSFICKIGRGEECIAIFRTYDDLSVCSTYNSGIIFYPKLPIKQHERLLPKRTYDMIMDMFSVGRIVYDNLSTKQKFYRLFSIKEVN